jgi:1-acyl-sn-glycerol-3-phosphate acyltransferase
MFEVPSCLSYPHAVDEILFVLGKLWIVGLSIEVVVKALINIREGVLIIINHFSNIFEVSSNVSHYESESNNDVNVCFIDLKKVQNISDAFFVFKNFLAAVFVQRYFWQNSQSILNNIILVRVELDNWSDLLNDS